MDRLVTIDEYVVDISPKNTHKPYLRDGGALWQILNIQQDGTRYKIETIRGTFCRNPEELIVIRQNVARTATIRKA